MIAEARLTRTGVFVYRNADGTERREYRSPAEVFKADSLASFRGVPVTNEHPPEMINATNATRYMKGAVLDTPHRDGQYMVATIAVHDAATIDDMERGKNQVSNGYDCDLDETPGVSPDGERYDAAQLNIIGNHLALVPNARAGAAAAVRMDAACRIDEPAAPASTRTDGAQIMDLTQALAALAQANEKIGALNVRCDAADKALTEATKRGDKLEAERDDAKQKLVIAEQARNDAADPARVKARVLLETSARPVIGDKLTRTDASEIEISDATDREIKLAVIEHVTGVKCDVGPDGKRRSDDYVGARYDAAVERADASAETFRDAQGHIAKHRADVDDVVGPEGKSAKVTKARLDMVEANQNAYKTFGTTTKGN